MRVCPSAIQVEPQKRSSVVSINHSVRVEHWYNLKNITIAQLLTSRRQQIPDHPFSHQRGLRLPWVHPSGNHHCPLSTVEVDWAMRGRSLAVGFE
jgi:hypothetical protein